MGTTTSDFADNAFIFADSAAANTFTPTPFLRPGDLSTIHIGDTSASGSPEGGGRNAGDAVPDPHIQQLPPPPSMIWCRGFKIICSTHDLIFSFDGTNIHGYVKAGTTDFYLDRYEAGIAIAEASAGQHADYILEAW